LGALLRKYDPSLRVVILERESFPRDHIGESQLPKIAQILDEMGAWDKVEAANFPVKVGATYRWGNTKGLWKLEFLPVGEFVDEVRPAKFAGQRRATAFQVDRSVYDKILLDHARELGCEVYEQVKVDEVLASDDTVKGLKFSPQQRSLEGTSLEAKDFLVARYFVDGSGASGILRRKMGIEVESPTNLRNIAIWDYWQNAEWAETVGNGGTRIQVLSLEWGWLWFIPISRTRTSIGLVVPVQTFKEKGKSPEELYLEAISAEPRVSKLTTKAQREGGVHTTNDWSYIANRIQGENWFLVGDSCGFADPILSAGMTLAHTSARRVAYTILELDRGNLDPGWLKAEYDSNHRAQIRHHIRFADFWYASNGCFTDLKENCAEIARYAGLTLSANDAFLWLSTGGFAGEDYTGAAQSTFRFRMLMQLTEEFTGDTVPWRFPKKNEFRLNLAGAQRVQVPIYEGGKIEPISCYRRDGKTLPLHGRYAIVFNAISREPDGLTMLHSVREKLREQRLPTDTHGMSFIYDILESMIIEGWLTAKLNKKRPLMFAGEEAEA
jgi:flavin-dependent dehydrogenase